jgi:hypothetical protein
MEEARWEGAITSLFIHLYGCLVGFDTNHLTDKPIMADAHLQWLTRRETVFPFEPYPTSSYIAHPSMFSATMTGPETENTAPWYSSPASASFLDGIAAQNIRRN